MDSAATQYGHECSVTIVVIPTLPALPAIITGMGKIGYTSAKMIDDGEMIDPK